MTEPRAGEEGDEPWSSMEGGLEFDTKLESDFLDRCKIVTEYRYISLGEVNRTPYNSGT